MGMVGEVFGYSSLTGQVDGKKQTLLDARLHRSQGWRCLLEPGRFNP